MSRLQVTSGLLDQLVGEVGPLVEDMTGWNLALPTLCKRVLSRERGYEEIVLRRLEALGVATREEGRRELFDEIVEYVVERCVAGAYEPSTGELLLVRENVDDGNLDGLRVVVAHELVHRGQHVRYPSVLGEIDVVLRGVYDYTERGGSQRRFIAHNLKQVQSAMTLLESHAAWVEERLRKSHFPLARTEARSGLAASLLGFFGRAKLAQYRDAQPLVGAAVARGRVDALYESLAGGGALAFELAGDAAR